MDQCKPEIEYPCTWTYRIIGSDEQAIREAVRRLLGDAGYVLTPSNTSATGKYVSLVLKLVVIDEQQRLGISRDLLAEETIRYVL